MAQRTAAMATGVGKVPAAKPAGAARRTTLRHGGTGVRRPAGPGR